MKAFVGVTDWNWFSFLSRQVNLEEVNFWQPGGARVFQTLAPGDLFLFKLRSPRNAIVGGGFFAHSALLPLNLAWDSFGTANGAASVVQMTQLIDRYRSKSHVLDPNYTIGCILLSQPFFLPEDRWIPTPTDWSRNIVQGKSYELAEEPGISLFARVRTALAQPTSDASWPALLRDFPADSRERYGQPVLVSPRLGQGSFRVLVTEAYERKCAITGEKVLPVLEAAHIKPFANDGPHQIDNGLLVRSDLHILFDRGYVTVTPEHRLEVSGRIHEEFDNGRAYYAFHGQEIRLPVRPDQAPRAEYLAWHNDVVFRG